MKLREKPGCWQAADQIIEKSSLPQGRYFGLMALDDAINTRWKILPEGQRTGIKNFIVNKIISLSKDEESSILKFANAGGGEKKSKILEFAAKSGGKKKNKSRRCGVSSRFMRTTSPDSTNGWLNETK